MHESEPTASVGHASGAPAIAFLLPLGWARRLAPAGGAYSAVTAYPGAHLQRIALALGSRNSVEWFRGYLWSIPLSGLDAA